ncbi:hypothetical protein AZ66_21510 [Paenibacillus sp. E194]|nr:hypothetical protein AZ66_21510 [Paenibacillus sp. E194]
MAHKLPEERYLRFAGYEKSISGGSFKWELTLEGKYARLEVQNALLKAENELLKKIRFAERGQCKG